MAKNPRPRKTRSTTSTTLPSDQEAEIDRIVDAIAVQSSRMGFNSARVERLVSLHNQLVDADSTTDVSDILRSAVVLLHASLEDYIRTVAAAYLPYTHPDVLNEIPLAGSGRERPEKFFLGALTPFRGQTVDNLIEQSVTQYLENATYNSSSEVARLVANLGIDVENVRPFLPAIDELMKRRHLIVHRADLCHNAVQDLTVNPISGDEVAKRRSTAVEFSRLLTTILTRREIRALIRRTRELAQEESEKTREEESKFMPPAT